MSFPIGTRGMTSNMQMGTVSSEPDKAGWFKVRLDDGGSDLLNAERFSTRHVFGDPSKPLPVGIPLDTFADMVADGELKDGGLLDWGSDGDDDEPEPLTVKQLIEVLSKLDSDAKVGVHSSSENRDIDYIDGASRVYDNVVIMSTIDEED